MKKLLLFSVLIILISNQSFAQCGTSISGTLTSCSVNCNGSVTFTSTSGTPPYNLVITNGPSVQYTSSYTWNNVCPGSYHYDVTGASASCNDTGTVVVTAMPVITPSALTIQAYDPNGNPLTGNPVVICQSQTIDFYINPPFINVLPNTYTWEINGTPVQVQNNLSNYLNASFSSSSLADGDSVVLEVDWDPNACISPNPSISQPIYFIVTPNQPPTVTISDNSPSDTICHGTTVTFTANALEAGSPTYQWYLDGAPVSTSSLYTTLATLGAGNHGIYCVITSSEYCDTQPPVYNPQVTSDTTNFYINPCYYYVPQTGSLGPYFTCNSPFYDSQLDNPVNYSNNVNGLVKFCPAVMGQYTTITFSSISLHDGGDRLKIFAGSSASTFASDTISVPLFIAVGPMSVAGGPSITSTVPGGCLTAQFHTDAMGVAAGWVANITCSPSPLLVQENNIAENEIAIFPNPVTNQFTINVQFTILGIGIYNMLGEKIFNQQLTANSQQQITVDASSLAPGIYIVKVKSDKGESVAKFVKQ